MRLSRSARQEFYDAFGCGGGLGDSQLIGDLLFAAVDSQAEVKRSVDTGATIVAIGANRNRSPSTADK